MHLFRMSKAGLPVLLGLTLALATSAVFAQTEIRILPEAQSSALDGALEAGLQMESGGRWSEAISHYEDLLREFPRDRSIESRLELARLRYDLTRRYNDRSYCNALTSVSPQKALDGFLNANGLTLMISIAKVRKRK